MNKSIYFYIIHCIVVVMIAMPLGLVPIQAQADEQFGRFFTSIKQRKELDEFRDKADQVKEVVVDNDDLLLVEDEAVEVVPIDNIEVKGLVYRSNQKRTVWINDTNMNDADAAMGHLVVDDSQISKNHVTVKLQGGDNEYTLKVGQSLNPNSETISDLSVKNSGEIKESKAVDDK